MAARVYRVVLVNNTPFKLTRVGDPQPETGEYTAPLRLPEHYCPGDSFFWQSESSGTVFSGTKGRATYNIEDNGAFNFIDPSRDTFTHPDQLVIEWDNPYAQGATNSTGAFMVWNPQAGKYDTKFTSDYYSLEPRQGGDSPTRGVTRPLDGNNYPGPIDTDRWLELVPGLLAFPVPLEQIIDHAWALYALGLTDLARSRGQFGAGSVLRCLRVDSLAALRPPNTPVFSLRRVMRL
jgi:hypothetical protein